MIDIQGYMKARDKERYIYRMFEKKMHIKKNSTDRICLPVFCIWLKEELIKALDVLEDKYNND